MASSSDVKNLRGYQSFNVSETCDVGLGDLKTQVKASRLLDGNIDIEGNYFNYLKRCCLVL